MRDRYLDPAKTNYDSSKLDAKSTDQQNIMPKKTTTTGSLKKKKEETATTTTAKSGDEKAILTDPERAADISGSSPDVSPSKRNTLLIKDEEEAEKEVLIKPRFDPDVSVFQLR